MKRSHLCLLGLSLLPGPLLADAMQCAGGIIETGAEVGPYRDDVARKCGPPTDRSESVWRYEREAFSYILTFEDDGELISIEQEPRE